MVTRSSLTLFHHFRYTLHCGLQNAFQRRDITNLDFKYQSKHQNIQYQTQFRFPPLQQMSIIKQYKYNQVYHTHSAIILDLQNNSYTLKQSQKEDAWWIKFRNNRCFKQQERLIQELSELVKMRILWWIKFRNKDIPYSISTTGRCIEKNGASQHQIEG